MTPTVPAVLDELAGLLVRNAAPDVPAPERAAALGISAALLAMLAQTFDGAAALLAEENRAFRALLGETGEDADLRVSALKAANDGLRARLIEAQIAAEAAGDAARQDAIWAELRASTERRKLAGAPI